MQTVARRALPRLSRGWLACRYSTAAARPPSTPLQETENVRTLINLADVVRQEHREQASSSSPPRPARLPTRLNTRSWADEAKARAAAAADKRAGAQGARDLDEEAHRRLVQPKRMYDSFVELSLPFRSRPEVLEKYIATSGSIRLGKLFEDLDNLAGDISYTHVLGGRPTAADHHANPIFIVTASVDRLDLLERLQTECDYRLSGMVIYVGSSSMEVLVTVQEQDSGRTCLTGRFTMATRNAATGKSQPIAPLDVRGDAEARLFEMGAAHKSRKKLEAKASLDRVPPTSDEAALLHDIWLHGRQEQQMQTVKMQDTILDTVMHMHPQQRNVHMKVFGGFLMRAAYETAWMGAAMFAQRPVDFLSLDALSFHLPVPIGAVLSLTSHVTYTTTAAAEAAAAADCQQSAGEGGSSIASVVVLAEVVDVETGERNKSNTFHFSFDIGPAHKRVVPQSYSDSMAWIEGRRRVELGEELRRIYRMQ